MAGPIEPTPAHQPDDIGQLRVSDSDRHKVADILRDAAGEGRLDLDELDQRLEATYAAKTYADLVPITSDLPFAGRPTASVPVDRPRAKPPGLPAPHHNATIAVMSGLSRRGVWEVGATHTTFAVMGGVELDLREARFTARETVIYANTFWGGIDITVNRHTHLIVEGVGIMGAFDQGRDQVEPELTADSPTVRVKGMALMGAVSVTRKTTPGDEPPRRSLHGH